MTLSIQELTRLPEVDASLLAFVTILIPTKNCSQNLSQTIDSILVQEYPSYEILVIDAGSTDRTLEVVQSYGSKVRLLSSPTYDVYSMINQGIGAANGEYINILFPGDFYIHHHTLRAVMGLAHFQGKPQLIYCGTLLRDGLSQVKFLFRPLNLALLKKGQQPTSLQACWFKKELFQAIGLFRTDFQMRGGFDLFCRCCFQPEFHFASLRRAFIDYDLRWVTGTMLVSHFWETTRTIHTYFGGWAVIQWFWRQKNIRRFAKLWLKQLKMAFIGRK